MHLAGVYLFLGGFSMNWVVFDLTGKNKTNKKKSSKNAVKSNIIEPVYCGCGCGQIFFPDDSRCKILPGHKERAIYNKARENKEKFKVAGLCVV